MKKDRLFQAHTESGNALWFILIAIALLAALTMAVTRSSNTSEQTGNVERARILASDILGFSASVEKAVERMRLSGISENEISFDGPAELTGYENANCTRNECKVFANGGGGIAYKVPSRDATTQGWIFTGKMRVWNIGRDADSDIIMFLPGLSEALCWQINRELNIEGGLIYATDSPLSALPTPYTGTATDLTPNFLIDAYNTTKAQKSGCFRSTGGTGTNNFYFFHVLVAR